MRILLTGRNGQVGWELERSLQSLGRVIALARADCDLADLDALRKTLDRSQPYLIVNPAAHTAVDKAESEAELAFRLNAEAPAVMADWAKRHGAAFVHFSTDYVFDGSLERPYVEDDGTKPLSVYGRSKLAGEEAIQESGCPHLILRTSWVYGLRGHNFLRTMLRLAGERDALSVVSDQFGAPTWCRSIADATACLIAMARSTPEGLEHALRARGGVFHLTCSGATTWHGFTRAILDETGRAARVRLSECTSDQYPTVARRPKNSCLSGEKLQAAWGVHMPDWKEALRLCLGEMAVGGQ